MVGHHAVGDGLELLLLSSTPEIQVTAFTTGLDNTLVRWMHALCTCARVEPYMSCVDEYVAAMLSCTTYGEQQDPSLNVGLVLQDLGRGQGRVQRVGALEAAEGQGERGGRLLSSPWLSGCVWML